MNVKSLTFFIELSKGKDITLIANNFGTSAKTLVRNIHELEAEIGVALFTKSQGTLKLTQSGVNFLSHAEQIVKSVNAAEQDVRLIGQNQERRIDVGAHGSAMISTIPEIYNELSRQNHDIEIIMHDLSPEEQILALQKNIVQIVFERYFPQIQDIQVELVASEPICAALPTTHKLAKLKIIHIKELQNYPIIGCANKDFEKILTSWFKSHGCKPIMTQQKADSMMSAVALTSLGLGISITPSSMQMTKFNNVVYIPIAPEENPSIEMYCAYKAGAQSPQLRKVLQTIRDYRKSKQYHKY